MRAAHRLDEILCSQAQPGPQTKIDAISSLLWRWNASAWRSAPGLRPSTSASSSWRSLLASHHLFLPCREKRAKRPCADFIFLRLPPHMLPSCWPSAGAPGIQQPGEQPGTMSSNRSARVAPSRSLRPWLLLAISWACLSASCPSGHALPSGAATLGRARFAAAAAAAAGVRLRAQGAARARRLLVSVCSSRRLGLWQQSLQITDTHGHVVVCAWRADQGAVRAAQGSVRDGLAGHTYGSDREGGQVSVGLRLARSPV